MKKFFAVVTALLLLVPLSGCKKSEKGNLKFVTSCYPVYIMTLNIAKEVPGVEILNMSENHKGCLHDFQLQSEDLKRIEKSSAFIINGAGMESFLDKVTEELPNVKVVDSGAQVDLLKDDDCDCAEDHCEHEYNPHTWVSVSNCIRQVKSISQGLAQIDGSHAEQYIKNGENYVKKLEALKADMHLQLDGLKKKDIITFHEAFPYFAQEFGLNILAVISHEPGAEPSAKEIAKTIETVKATGNSALFVEPQYSSAAAAVISKETGAKIYTLDPAVTGENEKDSYLSAMRKNLEVLKTALN